MGRRALRAALCLWAGLGVVALLAGCSAPAKVYSPQESFGSVATYSRLFDAEGLPTAPRLIVEDGILKGWTLDLATGRKLGMASTASAMRSAGWRGRPARRASAISPQAIRRSSRKTPPAAPI